MSAELVRDIINYERLVGESSSQTMVDGDIVLAERNAELSKVLRMEGKTIVTGSEVIDDKVIVEGKVFFDILYSSNDDISINKVSAASNYNHTLQIPNANSAMISNVRSYIDHMEYEVINSRKIKVNAVVNINGAVYDTETVEVISDIRGEDVQILKEAHELSEYLGNENGETVIKARMELGDEERGEIKSILSTRAYIHKKDVNIQDGKIIVNGTVTVKVMYDALSDDKLHYAEQDVAFSYDMEMPEVKPDMKCDIRFKIGDINEEIKENETGERKIIEVEAIIGMISKVYMKREIQTIVDAYSSEERYDFVKEGINTLAYLGENVDSQTIKERISVGESNKPIAQILHITGDPVITDTKLVEDKILIEGVLNCSVIYAEAAEEGGMSSYEEEIPIKAVLDMPGVKIDMIPDVEINAINVTADRASDKEIDIKALIEYAGKVYYKSTLDIIKAVTEMMLPDISDMPSITIYSVQSNDTLWKIAKKYYTTIEDIVNLNELQDPDNIKVGMKLMIPKKTFMR